MFFEDKLSPRWQYSIWVLLAIRILVPVNVSKYIIPQLALWIEVFKENIEKLFVSNYCRAYEPITLHHCIPFINKSPQSITDWLFVIYVVGVVIFLLKYLISYIHLRILLNHGQPVSAEMKQKMLVVCDKYAVNPCKIVAVEGLSSAFICGVIRPVLVVPKNEEIDEKVLLHELLHLKHHDTMQNIGWCMLRSLHWCNPLIHVVINHIENDMESLCDQRVLELLEGEERREYGTILLSMANQKYARIPGTTSISNGGNNISKRIAAIVRFKKYPEGMALVSVCIILTLFWPTIIGIAGTYDKWDYMYYADPYDDSMAIARINRCGTMAGAIDMYAKGVYLMNGGYVATASSFSEHERIAAEIEEYGCYQPGKYVGDIDYLHDFYVYNIDQIAKDEYTALICYYADVDYDENTSGEAFIFLPITIQKEDAWVVKENGERYITAAESDLAWETDIIYPKKYYGKNDVGEVVLEMETKYLLYNSHNNPNNIWFTDIGTFDTSPKPNATFSYQYNNKRLTYTHLLDEVPHSYVELKVYDELEMKEEHPFDTAWRIFEYTDEWKGFITAATGGGGSMDGDIEEIELLPDKYIVKQNIGGIDMEDINLKEVTD